MRVTIVVSKTDDIASLLHSTKRCKTPAIVKFIQCECEKRLWHVMGSDTIPSKWAS